jgi:pimeloyl-ACP methyl ester carboxylesterase
MVISKKPDAAPRPGRIALSWSERGFGTIVAAGIAALAGLVSTWTMPHGPATAPQALIVMAGGLITGLAAGALMRSRWAMLIAPVAHVVAIELARSGVVGPTVGAVRLDQTFGILALILGRGLYGLIGLLPMALGAGLGRDLAVERSARPIPTTLGALILAALAVGFAIPASTPPILGADGQPLPGSIAELVSVRIGGHDQALMIRGYDTSKPVLLYLSGGPGQSSLPHPRVLFEDLSRDFIVVGWDQRGTGKSYAALDPTSTLTLDRAVEDTIEVTNYLRERFDEPKIYVLGESWGTILGVLAVQRQPELYYAYIGSGQMVNVAETDRRIYHDMLKVAQETGDAELEAQLIAFGEPPFADVPYGNGFMLTHYDLLYKPFTPPQAYIERGSSSGIDQFGIMGSEYNLIEKANVLRGLLDTFTVMYPQIQGVDFRTDATRLEVPVYVLDGQAELAARRDLALEWFEGLDAPGKRLYSFENAAHAVAFEQFEAFHAILVETIVPETYHNP